MSDTTRRHQSDDPSRGERAGPTRSDDAYAERRLVAERYILHARAGRVPDQAPGSVTDNPRPAPAAAKPERERLIADRYLLGPRIGGGRFGSIYSAEDVSTDERAPHRHVAVQLLWSELGKHDSLVERFQREFVRLGSWRQENIVGLLDFGSDGEQFFWTTELLDGASLRSIVTELGNDRLEESETRAVLLGVGQALQYAHARKKVHGAINLENVFITSDYVVKVLDFAAISISSSAARDADDLKSGRFAAKTSDDVYGFACLAYELLSGRHPYGGSLPEEARDAGLKPGRIKGLSRQSWAALCRGLALTPERRTATVGEFLAELKITGNERLEPVGSRRETLTERKTPSRAAKLVTRTAALVASMGLAYIGYGLLSDNTRTPAVTGIPAGAAPAATTMTSDAAGADEAISTDQAASPAVLAPPGDGTSIADTEPDDSAVSAAADTVGNAPLGMEPTTAQGAPASSGFEFARTGITVAESSAVAELVIRRTGSTSGERSLSWWTIGDTAVEDEDFASFGTLVETFADGEQNLAIHIPLVVDAIAEPPERFFVAFSYDSMPEGATGARAEVTIVDGQRIP